MNLSLNLNPFFAKKVNPFCKMNPLGFLYPFIQLLTSEKAESSRLCLFAFVRATRFEIGRKLRSNLSAGPNSPMDCFSAKAATGGNPVIRTKKYCRKGYIFCSIFLSIAKAMAQTLVPRYSVASLLTSRFSVHIIRFDEHISSKRASHQPQVVLLSQ